MNVWIITRHLLKPEVPQPERRKTHHMAMVWYGMEGGGSRGGSSYLHQLHSAKTAHAQRSNHLNQIHVEVQV